MAKVGDVVDDDDDDETVDVLNDVDSVAICNNPMVVRLGVREVCRGGRFGGMIIEEKALALTRNDGGHDHDDQLHKPMTAVKEKRSKRPSRTSLRRRLRLLLLLLLPIVINLRVDLLFSTPMEEASNDNKKGMWTWTEAIGVPVLIMFPFVVDETINGRLMML
jgi:hypothetical protein